LTALTYVAAKTKKVRLGTAILMSPLRIPSILAKTAATIDFLSSGRLVLGLALGSHLDEYSASSTPINERVARFLEGIKILRLLWREENVSFQGRFWKLENANIVPKPAAGVIPIWMGGSAVGSTVNDFVVRRAGKHGDGWLGAGSTDTKAFEDSYKRFVRYAREFGRDPNSLGSAKRVYIHVDRDEEKAKHVLKSVLSAFYSREFEVKGRCVYGSNKKCVEELSRLVEAGARTIILHPVSDQLQQAETLAREVIPELKRSHHGRGGN